MKVQKAEEAWNSRDPERVALAYTEDSQWRNRAEFFSGRDSIRAFLRRKWDREHDYRLRKELWSFTGARISVRFEYEWHDDAGQWFRSHGNEQWEFADDGLMQRREASINDIPIQEIERKFRWERNRAQENEPIMTSTDKAVSLLSSGETGLALFTDGTYLERNEDGTGQSGRWKVSSSCAVSKVIIYCRDRQNDIYIADFDGVVESDSPGRYVVKFQSWRCVGSTENNWHEFADAGTNPVRYLKGQ